MEEESKIINLALTVDEAEVLSNYLLNKVAKLEEAGLKDSYCYPKLYSIYLQLNKKQNNNPRD